MREDYVRGAGQPEDGIYGLAPQPVQNTGTYQDGLRAMPEPTENVHKYNPPTKQQLLSEYEIRIRFAHKGCIVSVGCKELAFSTVEEAMASIRSYVDDPKNVGDYWKAQFNMI